MDDTFCGDPTCPYLTKSSGTNNKVVCDDGSWFDFTDSSDSASFNVCSANG